MAPTTTTLQRGDKVRVYSDPFTRRHPEGVARLIGRCGTPVERDGYEDWRVRFVGNGEPIVTRLIHPDDLV